MINYPTKINEGNFQAFLPIFNKLELLDYHNDIFHDNYIFNLKIDYMSTL